MDRPYDYKGANQEGFQPEVVSLDNNTGLECAALALAKGWPVVIDYGATFGTTFLTNIREQVAMARKEPEPLEWVSLVTNYDTARGWIDVKRLHPQVAGQISIGVLQALENTTFVRFPATSAAIDTLGMHHVNKDNEVQAFLVPDNEPLMRILREKYKIPYVAVRSANIHGEPEKSNLSEAIEYARQIGARVVALNKDTAHQEQYLRQRIGSQPIIRLPLISEDPVVTLVRAGNTHPSVIQSLVYHTFPGVEFKYLEEKAGPERVQYNPLSSEPGLSPDELRNRLLKAAGLS